LALCLVIAVIGSLVVSPANTTQQGYALSFDGDDYVEVVGNAESFQRITDAKQLTVEGWFKPEAPTEGGLIEAILMFDMEFVGAPLQAFIRASLRAPGAAQGAGSGTFTYSETWHHVALVWKADTRESATYINGIQRSYNAFSITEIGTLEQPLLIGRRQGADGFIGQIDEVRISNVVRYTENFTPLTTFSADANTVALWHFDEGVGTVVHDASGNGNDGEIIGATWVDTLYPVITPTATLTCPECDVNDDGVVNVQDLMKVADNWHK
jgi:hypothetical protein